MTMMISEKTIMELIIRAKSRPGENLALVAERYQTLREVQWPTIRHIARLSPSTPDQVVSNAKMSLAFENGSLIRCFSADRLDQMRYPLRFTGIWILEEITVAELNILIEAGVIPPKYVAAGITPMNGPPAAHHDPEEV